MAGGSTNKDASNKQCPLGMARVNFRLEMDRGKKEMIVQLLRDGGTTMMRGSNSPSNW